MKANDGAWMCGRFGLCGVVMGVIGVVVAGGLVRGGEDGGLPGGGVWSLAGAIEAARRSSPSAEAAAQRIRGAQAMLGRARAGLSPRLVAESDYLLTDNPPLAFMSLLNQRQLGFEGDFNNPDPTDNWRSAIRAEWAIFTGGGTRAAIEAAERALDAAGHEAEAVLRVLDFQVAMTYFQILRAGAVVEAAESSLASRRSNLQLARRLLEVKSALETDVLDMEVKVAEAETGVMRARNRGRVQESRFRMLLALEDGAPARLVSAGGGLADPGSTVASGRPELLALASRTGQAEAEIERAVALRRPRVRVFGDVRHDEGFTTRGGGGSWTVGVGVSLDLWDGRRNRSQAEAARAKAGQMREAERGRRLEIRHEVETARLELATARAAIQLARKAVTHAEKSLELNRVRFEQGLALSTQLIDSETALTSARVRLANSRFEEQIALASLRHALGTGIID